MPLIQLNLTDEEAEKMEHYAIIKKLTGKQQAIQDIIDNIEIEFKITKDGHRFADIKLKK